MATFAFELSFGAYAPIALLQILPVEVFAAGEKKGLVVAAPVPIGRLGAPSEIKIRTV